MVLSKSQVMEQVKGLIGENADDSTLKFLEDISDTLDDLETKSKGDGEDWKAKYDELDKSWRDKYRERFFSGTSETDEKEPKNDLLEPSGTGEEEEDEEKEPLTFEELFEEQ